MDGLDSGNLISLLIGSFFQRLPELIVILAGSVFCFFNMKKAPAASRLTLIGLMILLIINLTSVFIPLITTRLVTAYHDDLTTYAMINIALGFVFSLIGSAALGLIISSVWLGRKVA